MICQVDKWLLPERIFSPCRGEVPQERRSLIEEQGWTLWEALLLLVSVMVVVVVVVVECDAACALCYWFWCSCSKMVAFSDFWGLLRLLRYLRHLKLKLLPPVHTYANTDCTLMHTILSQGTQFCQTLGFMAYLLAFTFTLICPTIGAVAQLLFHFYELFLQHGLVHIRASCISPLRTYTSSSCCLLMHLPL